jgi:hypothetical protein
MGAEISGKTETVIGNGQPLASDFVPRRWLRGGHLQTAFAAYLPREDHLPLAEERLFSVEQDVQILTHCHWHRERGAHPTLVVLHGLEGSGEAQYVIGTANKAWDAGMNVVRMNMRNCGGSESLTRTLYNSSMSGDVAAVVKTLIEEDGLPAIAVAGFSMGGNLVLKMDGEWGDAPPPQVKAVVAISPAMDLSFSATALHEWQNRIYEYSFLIGLYCRMQRKVRMCPDLYQSYPLLSIRSLREFDDKITARYGGFAGAEDYYQRAGASRLVDRIAVPTLVIHSIDDPFIRITPATQAKILGNPHIRYIETEHGGHCAFLAEPAGYDGRWAEKKIMEFALETAEQPLSR